MADNVIIGNNTYKAFFTHYRPDDGYWSQSVLEKNFCRAINLQQVGEHITGNIPDISAFTICEIKDGNRVLGIGFSFCSGKDQFSKRVGRTISKNRAVQKAIENIVKGKV